MRNPRQGQQLSSLSFPKCLVLIAWRHLLERVCAAWAVCGCQIASSYPPGVNSSKRHATQGVQANLQMVQVL